MFRRILAPLALAAACVQAQQSQLTITDPSQSQWWVSGSVNTLAWTCTDPCPYSAYTVVLSNSDKSILAAPLALIANVPNYDVSFSVNQQQSSQPASTTYTLSLANIQNISDIYASTQFEIKAQGSPYPATSAAASPSGTTSAGSASSTSSGKSGALTHYVPAGVSMAAALVLGLVVA